MVMRRSVVELGMSLRIDDIAAFLYVHIIGRMSMMVWSEARHAFGMVIPPSSYTFHMVAITFVRLPI